MKKLIIALMMIALPCLAQQRIMVTDGTNVYSYLGTGTTNSTTNNISFLVHTNQTSDVTFSGITRGIRSTNNDEFVTLYQLNEAIGSLSVLYASTNTSLRAGYLDARTFRPTHSNTVITLPMTANTYLTNWISNTNLITTIRQGIASITARMKCDNGKTATAKPEIYIRYSSGAEPELFETGQAVTLSANWTDFNTTIDCPSNVIVPSDAQLVVKWKTLTTSAGNNWYFECGSNLVIAVRMPVAYTTPANVQGGTNITTYVENNNVKVALIPSPVITNVYLYFANTTNYVGFTADAANYYVTRCSNGTVNIKTNSLYP